MKRKTDLRLALLSLIRSTFLDDQFVRTYVMSAENIVEDFQKAFSLGFVGGLLQYGCFYFYVK